MGSASAARIKTLPSAEIESVGTQDATCVCETCLEVIIGNANIFGENVLLRSAFDMQADNEIQRQAVAGDNRVASEDRGVVCDA